MNTESKPNQIFTWQRGKAKKSLKQHGNLSEMNFSHFIFSFFEASSRKVFSLSTNTLQICVLWIFKTFNNVICLKVFTAKSLAWVPFAAKWEIELRLKIICFPFGENLKRKIWKKYTFFCSIKCRIFWLGAKQLSRDKIDVLNDSSAHTGEKHIFFLISSIFLFQRFYWFMRARSVAGLTSEREILRASMWIS